MNKPAQDHPNVAVFPPLLFAITVTLGGALHFAVPVRVLPTLPARLAGGLLGATSVLLTLWANATMTKAGTNVDPGQPTRHIVATGPFRITRNPMYVSLALMQFAVGLLIDGLLPLAMLVPLVLILHFGVIRREEAYMTAKFGEDYLAYQRRVRRWL